MNATVDKREHILEAGLNVLRQHGYNGTGVKDIVDAANIPKGSFYNYFESKEVFVIAALQRVADASIGELREVLLDPGVISPKQQLIKFFVSSVEGFKSEDQYCHGCLLGTICQEMADVSEPIRIAAERASSGYEAVFAKNLEMAQVLGELNSEVDVESLARFIFIAWEGALLRMKTCKNSVPLEVFLSWLKHILHS